MRSNKIKKGVASLSIEDVEISKERKSFEKDVNKLVNQYSKIMEWDIPDIGEAKARTLVLDEIVLAISQLESQYT